MKLTMWRVVVLNMHTKFPGSGLGPGRGLSFFFFLKNAVLGLGLSIPKTAFFFYHDPGPAPTQTPRFTKTPINIPFLFFSEKSGKRFTRGLIFGGAIYRMVFCDTSLGVLYLESLTFLESLIVFRC